MLPSQYLEQGWTQGNFAIAPSGISVPCNSDKAHAWCLRGALSASYHDGTLNRNLTAKFSSAIIDKTHQDAMVWNDDKNRTQQQVINLAKEIEQELDSVLT